VEGREAATFKGPGIPQVTGLVIQTFASAPGSVEAARIHSELYRRHKKANCEPNTSHAPAGRKTPFPGKLVSEVSEGRGGMTPAIAPPLADNGAVLIGATAPNATALRWIARDPEPSRAAFLYEGSLRFWRQLGERGLQFTVPAPIAAWRAGNGFLEGTILTSAGRVAAAMF
jgi:hypothetical protein